MLALLNAVDAHGRVSRADLIAHFHDFYLERQRLGLPPEKARQPRPSPLLNPHEVSDAQIWQVLARYPLALMDDFIGSDDEAVFIKPSLWSQMRAADLAELREVAQQRVAAYYEGW